MFYLIGVGHRVQAKQVGAEDSKVQMLYRDCLVRVIREKRPILIAEEFSDHALRHVSELKRAQHQSITRAVAESEGVEHRFCDPDEETRRRIGYVEGGAIVQELAWNSDEELPNAEMNDRGFATEVAKYWPIREQFWLDQLRDVLEKDAIFVCGDAHIESLGRLLDRNTIRWEIVERQIGVTQADKEWWRRVTAYLEAHPELYD